MNRHGSPFLRPVVVHTRSPWADWRFRLAGVALVLGVFGLGAYLEDPEPQPEDPAAAYQRGLADGRRQLQLASRERVRQAWQAGMDEAFTQCAATARVHK